MYKQEKATLLNKVKIKRVNIVFSVISLAQHFESSFCISTRTLSFETARSKEQYE